MKVTIEAEAQEIAALVVELQERRKRKFVPHDAEGEKPGGINQKCCR